MGSRYIARTKKELNVVIKLCCRGLMTAEIAILNKTAVALAADSAVTISAGSSQEKIYDSADKLFELSDCDPIGVMINNDMNFMEAPLPVLIKKYRMTCPKFTHVEHAATHFLEYLHKFGCEAPESVKLKHLRAQIMPLIQLIENRYRDAVNTRIFGPGLDPPTRPFVDIATELLDEQIDVISVVVDRSPEADFIGENRTALSASELVLLQQLIAEGLSSANADQQSRVLAIIRSNIGKSGFSRSATGVVVAGFGSEELFPTLVSFEVYGVIGNRLTYVRTNNVDIDRNGDRARVLPFAQREMVERFLYGLDAGIERKITQFCRSSVPHIRERIIDRLEMGEEDRSALIAVAESAEQGFFDDLAQESFAAIRVQSQTEIEDMVEFMPISEMAKMAEALVNLTSIKRRVSRGMETVGGPIDVAVISRSDGFVWVRRKHYFPPELNNRYFDRIRSKVGQNRESDDDKDLQSGDAGA